MVEDAEFFTDSAAKVTLLMHIAFECLHDECLSLSFKQDFLRVFHSCSIFHDMRAHRMVRLIEGGGVAVLSAKNHKRQRRKRNP